MRHLIRPWLAILLLAVGALAQDAPDTVPRTPVPDEASIKKAEAEARELFKAEYKSTDPADRRALARKLFEAGGRSDLDAATRYAVLREAADIAAQAEDLGTSFAAVDRLAGQFEVEPFGLKADALVAARKAARRTDTLAKIVITAVRTAREARLADRLDPAVRALKEAENAAKGTRDPALSKSIVEEAKLLAAAKKDLAEVEEARTRLAGSPDDAKSNLTLGRWLAFEKGRMKDGLPHLAKGADKRLAEAAKLDLEGFDALRIGEAWMKLTVDPRLPRTAVLNRACEWLRKAWDAEDPLGKERLRARILALLATGRTGKPAADSGPAPWTIMGGQSKVSWDPTITWSGERSVKLNAASTRATDPKAWTGFYQRISRPVVAGTEYRVSVRALTDQAGGGNGVWLSFWNAEGKPIRETAFMFAPDLPVWTFIEGKLEAPQGAVQVEVSFHHDSTSGSVWIDAVSLTCQGEDILGNGDLEPK